MNWLLLRGLVREKKHWTDFPDQLEQMFPGHKTLCLDMPGTGEFFRETSPTRIRDTVDHMRRHWLSLRPSLTGDWSVLSISLGGMIALDWIAAHPQDFKNVVIINSSAAGLSPFFRRLRPGFWPNGIRGLLVRDPEKREKILLESLCNDSDIPTLAKTFGQLARERPVSVPNGLRQLIAAMRFRPPQHIPVPMLVLASRLDRLVHCSCSERLATFYGAPLRMHPTAGHDLPLDAPDWLLTMIREWGVVQ